mgnify:CR=1 FL=1
MNNKIRRDYKIKCLYKASLSRHFDNQIFNLVKNKKIIDLTIFDSNRPTTEKRYFISGKDRLLKVDKVENSPINEELQMHIIKQISS